MRRVRCGECGKAYDFDQDDFCPRCGAFNQPPKSAAINADGRVVRVDGINERNHTGSFVHEELHEENRERKRMGLSKGVRRTPVKQQPRFATSNSTTGPRPTTAGQQDKKTNKSVGRIIGIIIFLIVFFNIFNGLIRMLFFW